MSTDKQCSSTQSNEQTGSESVNTNQVQSLTHLCSCPPALLLLLLFLHRLAVRNSKDKMDKENIISQTKELKKKSPLSLNSLLTMISHDEKDLRLRLAEQLLLLSDQPQTLIQLSAALPLLVQLLHPQEEDAADVSQVREIIQEVMDRVINASGCKKQIRVHELLRELCIFVNEMEFKSSDQKPPHPTQAICALMKLSFDESQRKIICRLGGVQVIAKLLLLEHWTHTLVKDDLFPNNGWLLDEKNSEEVNETNDQFHINEKLFTKRKKKIFKAGNVEIISNASDSNKTTAQKNLLENNLNESSEHQLVNTVECVSLRRYACMALTNLTFGDRQAKSALCALPSFLDALLQQLHYIKSEELVQVTASLLRNLSWRPSTGAKAKLAQANTAGHLMQAALHCTRRQATLKCILYALCNLSSVCANSRKAICATEDALRFLMRILRDAVSMSSTCASATIRRNMRQLDAEASTLAENAATLLQNLAPVIANVRNWRMELLADAGLDTLLKLLRAPSLQLVASALGILCPLSSCANEARALKSAGAVRLLRGLVWSRHAQIAASARATLCNSLLHRCPDQSEVEQLNELQQIEETQKIEKLQKITDLRNCANSRQNDDINARESTESTDFCYSSFSQPVSKINQSDSFTFVDKIMPKTGDYNTIGLPLIAPNASVRMTRSASSDIKNARLTNLCTGPVDALNSSPLYPCQTFLNQKFMNNSYFFQLNLNQLDTNQPNNFLSYDVEECLGQPFNNSSYTTALHSNQPPVSTPLPIHKNTNFVSSDPQTSYSNFPTSEQSVLSASCISLRTYENNINQFTRNKRFTKMCHSMAGDEHEGELCALASLQASSSEPAMACDRLAEKLRLHSEMVESFKQIKDIVDAFSSDDEDITRFAQSLEDTEELSVINWCPSWPSNIRHLEGAAHPLEYSLQQSRVVNTIDMYTQQKTQQHLFHAYPVIISDSTEDLYPLPDAPNFRDRHSRLSNILHLEPSSHCSFTKYDPTEEEEQVNALIGCNYTEVQIMKESTSKLSKSSTVQKNQTNTTKPNVPSHALNRTRSESFLLVNPSSQIRKFNSLPTIKNFISICEDTVEETSEHGDATYNLDKRADGNRTYTLLPSPQAEDITVVDSSVTLVPQHVLHNYTETLGLASVQNANVAHDDEEDEDENTLANVDLELMDDVGIESLADSCSMHLKNDITLSESISFLENCRPPAVLERLCPLSPQSDSGVSARTPETRRSLIPLPKARTPAYSIRRTPPSSIRRYNRGARHLSNGSNDGLTYNASDSHSAATFTLCKADQEYSFTPLELVQPPSALEGLSGLSSTYGSVPSICSELCASLNSDPASPVASPKHVTKSSSTLTHVRKSNIARPVQRIGTIVHSGSQTYRKSTATVRSKQSALPRPIVNNGKNNKPHETKPMTNEKVAVRPTQSKSANEISSMSQSAVKARPKPQSKIASLWKRTVSGQQQQTSAARTAKRNLPKEDTSAKRPLVRSCTFEKLPTSREEAFKVCGNKSKVRPIENSRKSNCQTFVPFT